MQTIIKLTKLLCIVTLITLRVSTVAFGEVQYDNDLLLGVLFKSHEIKEKAIVEIKKLDNEILQNEKTIQQSQRIISLAQGDGDEQSEKAEIIARQASLTAQAAKSKN